MHVFNDLFIPGGLDGVLVRAPDCQSRSRRLKSTNPRDFFENSISFAFLPTYVNYYEPTEGALPWKMRQSGKGLVQQYHERIWGSQISNPSTESFHVKIVYAIKLSPNSNAWKSPKSKGPRNCFLATSYTKEMKSVIKTFGALCEVELGALRNY